MGTVLIVESDKFLADFYQELLVDEGFEVQMAEDGEVALDKIRQGGFELILLDLDLPKKDGMQVLRELQTNPPKNENGAILVLTALSGHDSLNQCFALGAKGYLIKTSLNPDQAISQIEPYLNIKPI